MLAPLRRYLRAFALALQYTLRGDKPPLLKVRERYPDLAAWWEQTVALVAAVERSASTIDPAAVTIHADGRDISMATILSAVKYHAQREYPYLMAHNDPYSPMTLQATNLNDRYLVTQLAQNVPAAVKTALDALLIHLGNMPDNSSAY